eukprot:756474-Hanusia_phi.AAC.1
MTSYVLFLSALDVLSPDCETSDLVIVRRLQLLTSDRESPRPPPPSSYCGTRGMYRPGIARRRETALSQATWEHKKKGQSLQAAAGPRRVGRRGPEVPAMWPC